MNVFIKNEKGSIILKNYKFSIKMSGIGLGYVSAKSLKEAKEKIANHEWDDIYDHVDVEYDEVIEIEEDE